MDVRHGWIVVTLGIVLLLGIVSCEDQQTFEPLPPVDKYLYGKVTDDDGNPLSNVTVSIYSLNSFNAGGDYMESPVTDQNGEWDANLTIDQGMTLRLVYSRSGYADIIASATLTRSPPDTLNIGTASIPPVDFDDVYRVVLTWGNAPSDLDAHLTGPKGDGSRFHIYWNNKIAQDAEGNTIARLISDRRNGYGPESIAIKELLPGTYRFSVHNYSANNTIGDSLLVAQSNARVRVFDQDGVVDEFAIAGDDGPEERIGNLWRVFEVDGETGTISYINEIRDGVPFDDNEVFRIEKQKPERVTIP